MLDDPMRRVKEIVAQPVARVFGVVHPTAVTLLAGLFGVLCAVAVWREAYKWGFLLWFINRTLDGLDGTMARVQNRQSDLGGYLDIVIDFMAYAVVPIGLVLGRPTDANWLALSVMLASFYVNAASWMYLAAVLEKRRAGAEARGEMTSITMPRSIVGGFDTMVYYMIFIVWPAHLALWFAIVTVLVVASALHRILWAVRTL